MKHKGRPDKMWSYDRRYLVTSLSIAGLVWLELGLLAVWHGTDTPSLRSLSPQNRFGLRVVALGWPIVYGLALGMVYVIGNFPQGAAENPDPRAERLASMSLNGSIVACPAVVALALNLGLVLELLFT